MLGRVGACCRAQSSSQTELICKSVNGTFLKISLQIWHTYCIMVSFQNKSWWCLCEHESSSSSSSTSSCVFFCTLGKLLKAHAKTRLRFIAGEQSPFCFPDKVTHTCNIHTLIQCWIEPVSLCVWRLRAVFDRCVWTLLRESSRPLSRRRQHISQSVLSPLTATIRWLLLCLFYSQKTEG